LVKDHVLCLTWLIQRKEMKIVSCKISSMSECERSTYHLKTLLGLETRQLSLGFIAIRQENSRQMGIDDVTRKYNLSIERNLYMPILYRIIN